eukprot:gene33942-45470_t
MVLVGLVVDRVLLYEASDEDLSCLNLVVVPSHNNIHKIETPRFMVVVDENTGVVIDLRTTDIDCNIVINDANGVDCTISNKYDYWHLLPTTEHQELENVARIISFPENSTLMPGFIDCHVHLTIATDDYQIDHLRLSSADKALRALKAAQGLLLAGFTTGRSAGDADAFYPSFAAARSINRGDFEGSRIVGAGHYISVTGGGGDMNFMSPDNFGSCSCCSRGTDGIIADGQDQMITAVRKEIKYGSDWIKVLASGAFMTASTNAQDSPENTHLSALELTACVEEARRRRVPVMAH